MQTEATSDFKKIRIAQNTKTGSDEHSAETQYNVQQNSKFDFATGLAPIPFQGQIHWNKTKRTGQTRSQV
jgi:hypothetical protein